VHGPKGGGNLEYYITGSCFEAPMRRCHVQTSLHQPLLNHWHEASGSWPLHALFHRSSFHRLFTSSAWKPLIHTLPCKTWQTLYLSKHKCYKLKARLIGLTAGSGVLWSIGFESPCPSFYKPRRVGFTWKIWVGYNLPDRDSISTCLLYMIYPLNVF
jgi:hypothetical protein